MTADKRKKRKPKAAHGDGGWTRRADGRIEVRVTVTDPLTGEKRRLSRYAHTEAEANALRRQLAADAQAGKGLAKAPRTVASILDDWLAVSESRVRPLTARLYRSVIEHHLAPALGRHRADRLTARHVQAWLSDHAATHAASTTRAHLHILRLALGWAVKAGYLERNVAQLVSAPTPPRIDRPTLTPDQARALLAACSGHWSEAMLALALGLGLRRGEALGLRWRDVDFQAGQVAIRSQALDLPGSPGMTPDQPPKTSASRRTLPLPGRVRTALVAQRDRQRLACSAAGIAWSDAHFVCEEHGDRPAGVNAPSTIMRRALAAAGLPPMRFHDLRGVCASLLLADGVDIRVTMSILGHSSSKMTLETYARVNPEQMQRAGESMGRLLGG